MNGGLGVGVDSRLELVLVKGRDEEIDGEEEGVGKTSELDIVNMIGVEVTNGVGVGKGSTMSSVLNAGIDDVISMDERETLGLAGGKMDVVKGKRKLSELSSTNTNEDVEEMASMIVEREGNSLLVLSEGDRVGTREMDVGAGSKVVMVELGVIGSGLNTVTDSVNSDKDMGTRRLPDLVGDGDDISGVIVAVSNINTSLDRDVTTTDSDDKTVLVDIGKATELVSMGSEVGVNTLRDKLSSEVGKGMSTFVVRTGVGMMVVRALAKLDVKTKSIPDVEVSGTIRSEVAMENRKVSVGWTSKEEEDVSGEGVASMDEGGGDERISIVEAMLKDRREVDGVGVTNIMTLVLSLDMSTRLLPPPLTVRKGILVCTSLTSIDEKTRDDATALAVLLGCGVAMVVAGDASCLLLVGNLDSVPSPLPSNSEEVLELSKEDDKLLGAGADPTVRVSLGRINLGVTASEGIASADIATTGRVLKASIGRIDSDDEEGSLVAVSVVS